MKIQFRLSFFYLFLFIFLAPDPASAVVHPTPDKQSSNLEQVTGFSANSIDDLLNMSAKDLAKKRGKKLKLKERLGLFIIKKEIRRARKKGKSDAEIIQAFNEPRDSGRETISFILGFLFGLLGILFALLFIKNQARFALYGLLARLVILAFVLFYFFYNR